MDDARGDEGADASEVWGDVTTGFVELGNRLRTFFDAASDDEAGNEIRNAWGEFTIAAQRLGRSMTSAFQDEEVQEGAKNAFGSLIDAVGQSVREAGVQFSWTSEDEPEPDPAEEDDS